MAEQERKPKQDEQAEVQQDAREEREPQRFEKADAERDEKQRNEGEEEEERKRSVVRQALVERFDGVAGAMKNELGQNPHYIPDPRLSVEENRALEIVYRVKLGQDEEGNKASARTRKLLLNHALATLQPVLSVALAPELQPSLQRSYHEVLDGIEELRDELASATRMQMHSGRSTLADSLVDQLDAEKAAEAKLTQMGDLAWELVQLGKKRKRLRFSYDLTDHPIGHALAALDEQASNLIALSAKLARNAVKLAAAKADPERRERLTAERDRLGRELAEAVRELLASCRPDRTAADEVGGYRSLRERFAGLVRQHGEVTEIEPALIAARAVVDTTDRCLTDIDELVAAESGGAGKQ